MSSTYRETFDKLPISTKISNTENIYKKVCLSDFFFIHHKTWFFDTVRIWFFDMVDRQGKTNCKCSGRVTKIKGTTKQSNSLENVCGITMDTTDNR